MKAHTLILPARAQRPSLRVDSREIGVFVPLEALFPDLEASEATMAALLGTLSRGADLRPAQYGRERYRPPRSHARLA